MNVLLRESLVTIYKSFIRPHLDYGDIIYDQANNSSLHQNFESIQYSVSDYKRNKKNLSKKKFCQELGFDSPQQYVGKQNFVTYLK